MKKLKMKCQHHTWYSREKERLLTKLCVQNEKMVPLSLPSGQVAQLKNQISADYISRRCPTSFIMPLVSFIAISCDCKRTWSRPDSFLRRDPRVHGTFNGVGSLTRPIHGSSISSTFAACRPHPWDWTRRSYLTVLPFLELLNLIWFFNFLCDATACSPQKIHNIYIHIYLFSYILFRYSYIYILLVLYIYIFQESHIYII